MVLLRRTARPLMAKVREASATATVTANDVMPANSKKVLVGMHLKFLKAVKDAPGPKDHPVRSYSDGIARRNLLFIQDRWEDFDAQGSWWVEEDIFHYDKMMEPPLCPFPYETIPRPRPFPYKSFYKHEGHGW